MNRHCKVDKSESLIPIVRFSEFNGNWQVSQFGELFTYFRNNSFSRENLNYVDGNVLNVHYGDIHTKLPSRLNLESLELPLIKSNINLDKIKDENYCLIGDLIIADVSEDYEGVGKTVEITNLDGKKLLAGLHTFLARKNTNNLALGFPSHLMQTKRVKKQIKVLCNGTKVNGISKKSLAEISIIFPTNIDEQIKITSFFLSIDSKIEKLTRKKELLEEYKKEVMQRVFSYKKRFFKDGEIREGTLGDFGYFYYGKGAPKSSIKKGASTPCVRYGELYSTYNEEIKNIKSYTNVEPKNLKLSKGGEVLVPRVGEDPKDFANCSFLPFSDVAIGEMISVYNTEEDGLFMTYYINAVLKKELARLVEGGNVSNLYFRYVETIRIKIPSIQKQKKITNFLSSIDNKIDLLSSQILKTEKFKKGMLQQMFV